MAQRKWQHVRRDERGRWANTPTAESHTTSEVVMIDGSNNGAEVSSPSDLPRPGWQPTMSRANADAWVAGSAIDYDVYHVTTTQGNAESIKSLKSAGFEVDLSKGWGRMWGDGVYAATSLKHGKGWIANAFSTGIKDPVMLKLKIMVENPMVVDISDWVFSHEGQSEPGGFARHIEKQHKGFEKAFRQAHDRQVRKHIRAMEKKKEIDRIDPVAYGMAEAAKKLGFDAIQTADTDMFRLSFGASQIVVFDPTKVVVIDE